MRAGTWPQATLDGDPVAVYCQAAALSLTQELERRRWSLREVARLTGISHRTLGYLIAGQTVPDLGTIALLETALQKPLLPRDQ